MPRLSALNLASLAQLRLTEEDLPAPSPPCSPLPKFASPPCSPFRKGPDHSVVFQPLGHPKQSVIDGEIWPPIFLPENVRSAKAMRPFDSDVFICTYPKCGTTWIQQIVHQLIKADLSLSSPGNEMCHVSPMIERMGAKFAEGVAHPRVLKTHFNHMNLPKNPNAKFIYAVRNPKDALTSYFYHNRNFKIYDWAHGDFNVFFELFANGQLGFGDYFDHLITWLPHIHDDNVLFLKYEDMMEDLETAVVRIGEFLGGKARDAVEDPRRLAEIVKAATIDEMKKDQRRWFPESVLHREEFIRKGGSRDWKNHLSKEQSDRIDDLCRTRFAGTEAETWWRRELAWERPEEAVETAADDDEFVSVSRRNSLADVTAFLPPPRPDRRPSLASLSTGYGSVWSSS